MRYFDTHGWAVDLGEGGGMGHQPPPCPPSPLFSEANFIFLRKIKLRKREGVEEKNAKKRTQERGCAPKKVMLLTKNSFMYLFL